MSSPKYSVLYAGHQLLEEKDAIREFLYQGVKVIWFGNEDECTNADSLFSDFKATRLFQAFVYNGTSAVRIIDGEMGDCDKEFEEISGAAPTFNSGQYLVEHSNEHNIIVMASAGTGKTSVMVDRIMFLLMMGIARPSDIAMVTFTNEATNQMAQRLQKALVNRYRLTHNKRFLTLLEQISQISISTIDSFSLDVLRRYGVNIGYGQDVSVSSQAYELNDVLIDLIDREYDVRHRVSEALGTNLYDARRTLSNFYNKLSSMGISPEDINRMDWGVADGEAKRLQEVMRSVLDDVGKRLGQRMRRRDRTSLSTLIFNASEAMCLEGMAIDSPVRYLFVDEFQDTNLRQIQFITAFASSTGADLFVVGDPKQSIYRFRGADDSAFKELSEFLHDGSPVRMYELVNNYRTDPDVMDSMEGFFRKWVSAGLLDDFHKPVACGRDQSGGCRIKEVRNQDEARKMLVSITREELDGLRKRRSTGEATVADRVAVIVRTNNQLDRVTELFESASIPYLSDRDKPLYLSDAVRDFYAMVNSYVYSHEPQFIYDYLMSPYAMVDEPVDIQELMGYDGDVVLLQDYFLDVIDGTSWRYYYDRFRNEPSLAVLGDMVRDLPVVDNYVASLKRKGIKDPDYIRLMALKYRLNLDKLLGILFEMFAGDSASLYRISEFLRISIATNRDECEAVVDSDDIESAVLCMTVHKAKGLEFDTVILPFDWNLNEKEESEILVSADRKRIGWKFYKKKGSQEQRLTNSHYVSVRKEDLDRTKMEETRILYVAMTRAIRNLVLFRYRPKDGVFGWSTLLGGRIQ